MIEQHTYRGRSYAVLARFDGPNRIAEAKRYIATHTHVELLCDVDDAVIVVSDRDFGEPVGAPDDFDIVGWTSILGTK